MSTSAFRGPFKSRAELERHALRETKGQLSRATVTMFVDQVWPACEENYPSAETINMQRAWAERLAWERTAHMTDEELLTWLEDSSARGWSPSGTEEFEFTKASDVGEVQAARERNHLLPVMMASLDHPETILCPERYGKWVLPNGKEVVGPVADAYNEVIARRFKAAVEARERCAKAGDANFDGPAASITHTTLGDGTKIKVRNDMKSEVEANETWAERERRQAKEGYKFYALQREGLFKLAKMEQELDELRKVSDAADAAALKERQRRQARRQEMAVAELAEATRAQAAEAAARAEEERLARETVEAPERKAALEERKAQAAAEEGAKQVVRDQRAKDAAANESARRSAASEAKRLKKAERKARKKAPLEVLVQEEQREAQRVEDAAREAEKVKRVTRDLLRHGA